MESEIRELLSARGKEIARIVGCRSQAERKDSLNRVLRDVLTDSGVCYVDGALARYDGAGYVPVTMADIRDCVVNVLGDMGVGASDLGRMGDTSYSVLRRKEHCSDGNLVAFSNCVYDVVSGRTLNFDRGLFPKRCLPYAFDANAGCSTWEAFLAEVLPDASMRDVLQEFFGMCFVDRDALSIEKMALMVGSGANGKSVVCDVMRAVLGGGGNVGNLSPDQLQDQKQIAGLDGMLLNIAPDVRRGASFDSALKALSSSQEITGWKLYSGGVTVKCPPLAFALNEMPYFRDTTDAFFRRLLVFRFDVVIPEERQDRSLAARIVSTESCGVFRWMMEGRRRLLANRGMFTRCAAMDAALSELKDEVKTVQSPVLQFIDGMGYSVVPYFEGQLPERVPASNIVDGMGGTATKYMVTKELRKAGVETSRGGSDLFYHLFKIV